MQRTTRAQIEAQVKTLNELLGTPQEPWSTREDGKGARANLGNIHIERNNGGYTIHQMFNEGGGVSCPLGYHRLNASECWHALRVACSAIQLANERAKRRRKQAA